MALSKHARGGRSASDRYSKMSASSKPCISRSCEAMNFSWSVALSIWPWDRMSGLFLAPVANAIGLLILKLPSNAMFCWSMIKCMAWKLRSWVEREVKEIEVLSRVGSKGGGFVSCFKLCAKSCQLWVHYVCKRGRRSIRKCTMCLESFCVWLKYTELGHNWYDSS